MCRNPGRVIHQLGSHWGNRLFHYDNCKKLYVIQTCSMALRTSSRLADRKFFSAVPATTTQFSQSSFILLVVVPCEQNKYLFNDMVQWPRNLNLIVEHTTLILHDHKVLKQTSRRIKCAKCNYYYYLRMGQIWPNIYTSQPSLGWGRITNCMCWSWG